MLGDERLASFGHQGIVPFPHSTGRVSSQTCPNLTSVGQAGLDDLNTYQLSSRFDLSKWRSTVSTVHRKVTHIVAWFLQSVDFAAIISCSLKGKRNQNPNKMSQQIQVQFIQIVQSLNALLGLPFSEDQDHKDPQTTGLHELKSQFCCGTTTTTSTTTMMMVRGALDQLVHHQWTCRSWSMEAANSLSKNRFQPTPFQTVRRKS